MEGVFNFGQRRYGVVVFYRISGAINTFASKPEALSLSELHLTILYG